MNYFVTFTCLFHNHETAQIVCELQEYEDIYWWKSNHFFFTHSVFDMLEPEAKKT